MITKLLIENLILVEKAEMTFSKGFNVLTGETGAGKSAVMAAIAFLMGKRSDPQLIRTGASQAIVEGHFEANAALFSYFEEAGIANDPDDLLVIRREMKLEGKSAIFVNQQRVQGHVLKAIGEKLIVQVGQLAIMTLFDSANQLQLLDLFSGIDSAPYKELYFEERKLEKRVLELQALQTSKEAELKRISEEIEEIEKASLKEGEEEELFAEYSVLSRGEEMAALLAEWQRLISQEGGLFSQLQMAKRLVDQIARIDPQLAGSESSMKSASLELQEMARSFALYESRLSYSPERLAEIDSRLNLIQRLKRRWGDDVLNAFDKLKKRHRELLSLDDEVISLREALNPLTMRRKALALELTAAREKGASLLSHKLSEEIKALNMRGAIFTCELRRVQATQSGEDAVEFTLSPNIGEKALPLRMAASGGEISRVMLGLYALLAEKERTPTLLFDEIDANIGGETAQVVGEKLRQIGRDHQVLCITHFPQVARSAATHFRVRKEEMSGRTLTFVELLDADERREELKRMVGGEVFV